MKDGGAFGLEIFGTELGLGLWLVTSQDLCLEYGSLLGCDAVVVGSCLAADGGLECLLLRQQLPWRAFNGQF